MCSKNTSGWLNSNIQARVISKNLECRWHVAQTLKMWAHRERLPKKIDLQNKNKIRTYEGPHTEPMENHLFYLSGTLDFQFFENIVSVIRPWFLVSFFIWQFISSNNLSKCQKRNLVVQFCFALRFGILPVFYVYEQAWMIYESLIDKTFSANTALFYVKRK